MQQFDIEPVLGDLYEAGLMEGDWRPALEKLRISLNSAEAAFVAVDASITTETTGRVLSPASRDAYARYYGRLDPKRPLFANRGTGFLFNDAEHFDDRFVAHDPFYQEFSAPLGTRHTLDFFVGRNGAQDVYLSTMRSRAQGPYAPREGELLRRAGGHFLRALRLRETIRDTQAKARHATAALESLAYGIVVLDSRLRILLANGFARRAFADCRELAIHQGSFSPASGAVGQAFGEILRKASSGVSPALRLTRSDGRSMFLWGVGLPSSSPLAPKQEPGVLLVLNDPGRMTSVDFEDLQRLYGLTRAEAQLALALGEGQRLDAIAAGRRVKLSTARTQLLRVLAKTELHRQADLARVLASLAKPVCKTR